MNPATYLRVLGPEPWRVAYDEPSVRPDDSRYGENPNRLQRHTQFQVILKPAPDNAQELLLASYKALGIDVDRHDFRFVEDNWESPALGAWGLGWEVWLDGMEVTQFTYFQQAGGMSLPVTSVEITYGLERIIMSLQRKAHFKDILFGAGLTYGDIFMQNEMEMSVYNLDEADVDTNGGLFEMYEAESKRMLDKRLPVPAYNYLLKASHTFNILDSRGAVGVTERARYFQRMRALARETAKLWVARREELGFPLAEEVEKQEMQLPSVKVVKGEKADVLFELGVEELPAKDVSVLINQVREGLQALLKDARLAHDDLRVDGTPRRVTAFVKSCQTRQEDVTDRVRGPPLRVALKDGQKTKAAQGFMRSQGVTDDSLIEFDENEGYMYATVRREGQATAEVLAEQMPGLLGKVGFRKSMRWNGTDVNFSRPVRWMVCMMDDVVVPFGFGGIVSSDTTRSLRGGAGYAREIAIPSAARYHDVLSGLQIVLSRDERKNIIRTGAERLAGEVGGTVPDEVLQGELLEEVVDLVENPIPLRGSFDVEYLELPKEVLVTVMKKHQRYFPIIDSQGNLQNSFITVVNGDSNAVDLDAIREGNEAVLRARYSDAAFFYTKDSEGKRLADFVPKLEDLAFQEDLGSMLDKTNRVSTVTPSLCRLLDIRYEQDCASVAQLYKADLGTSMVVEMTSLAGTMGRHYAMKSGEVSPIVAQGIYEACLPRFSGDALAQSDGGAIVGIADRFDSLVGLFSVGLVPKSTADPFALRRAALGAVQTLLERQYSIDMKDIVVLCCAAFINQTGASVSKDVQEAVVEFVVRRLEGYLLDTVGIEDDIVKCVLAIQNNARNPVAALQLCRSVERMKKEESTVLANGVSAYSRAERLLRGVKDISRAELKDVVVREDLFESVEEKKLWACVESGLEEGDCFEARVKKLADMREQVDAYFDNVFVNAEEETVRRNRLAVCGRVVGVLGDFVDVAQLRLE